MRIYLSIILISTLSYLPVSGNSNPDKTVNLTCTVKACGGELWLFEFDGTTFKPLYQGKAKSDSLYVFNFPISEPQFYFLGNDRDHVKPIILGSEPKVDLNGKCNARSFTMNIENSPINAAYGDLKKTMNNLRIRHSRLSRNLRSAKNDKEKEKILEDMSTLDEEKLVLLDSMKTNNPYFASIVAVNTYLTFQSSEPGAYPNEAYYFADNFFKYADLGDEAYDRSSWLYEAFKGYASTLSSVKMDKKRHLNFLTRHIDQTTEGSRARKYALTSTIVTLKQKNHPNFVHFAERFIEEFKDTDPAAAADLKKQINVVMAFMEGGQAPDFSQKTPEGDDLKLSDFRGKVLLVDFWASWCGPCRRENPHVVKLYNKYKDKGFEILGVSLDNKKDRWLKAIEQDQLEWPHVSDLKGWSNEAAKLYNVTSIPQTILLDREGKIIARNLRGSSLAGKLSEIFESGDDGE